MYLSNFGENFYELILDNKLTPKTFAESTGIDLSLVYKYSRKEILPTLPNLITICDYFNCSADYILGLTKENPEINFKNAPPFYVSFRKLLDENRLTRYKFMKQIRLREIRFAKQSVDDWFNGKRYPTVDNAIILAKFFNTSLDYILDRE